MGPDSSHITVPGAHGDVNRAKKRFIPLALFSKQMFVKCFKYGWKCIVNTPSACLCLKSCVMWAHSLSNLLPSCLYSLKNSNNGIVSERMSSVGRVRPVHSSGWNSALRQI